MFIRLVILLSVVVLASCAYTNSSPLVEAPLSSTLESSVVSVDADPIKAVSAAPSCGLVSRDLTVKWLSRKYWCDSEGSTSTTDHASDDYRAPHGPVVAVRRSAPAAKQGRAVEQLPPSSGLDDSATNINEAVNPPRVEKYTYKKPLTIKRLAVAVSRMPESIAFAKNLKVLGPEGRASSESLREIVMGADKVKLRGLFLEEEVVIDTPVYREILSVGRSLAVRRHWEDMGIDTSHIKILHYDPDRFGRKVEVYFNDA